MSNLAETVVAKGTIVVPENTATVEMPSIPDTPDSLLVQILRTKRRHGSPGDINFRMWLHKEVERRGYKPEILAEGCVMVRTDVKSDTLFSSHVDTCHGLAESDGSMQELAYDPTFGDILLAQGTTSGCLGADDGAGVYVMLKMIGAKVPGTYLFHTGEEQGGTGSRAVLTKHRDLLDNFSRAIAFDRAVQRGGKPEVIATQGGVACASVAAAEALCSALNTSGAIFEEPYVVSHGGSFTDTKVYIGVIPECFNVGVWYASQHTNKEWLNVAGLEQLVKACIAIKWDDLPVLRKPMVAPVFQPYVAPKGKKKGVANQNWQTSTPRKGQAYDPDFDDMDLPFAFAHSRSIPPVKPTVKAPTLLEEVAAYTLEECVEFVEADPTLASNLLMCLIAKSKGLDAELAILRNAMGVV